MSSNRLADNNHAEADTLKDMLPLLLVACRAEPTDPAPASSDFTSRWEPADVVVVVIVDTMARQHMGRWQDEANTTPSIDAFFDQSAVLANTLTVRGLTSTATASVLTGVWPRTHRVRNNSGWPTAAVPTLIERFNDAGYHTVGLAANACQFIHESTDAEVCVWSQEVEGIEQVLGIGHDERDRMLLASFIEQLDARPADTPLFVWVHLMNPHDPYTRTEPWYSEFHPDPYTGDLDPEDPDQLDALILSEEPIDAADLAEIHAVYRSQLRETDAVFGSILEALSSRGLSEEAVVVLGVDHGESLGARNRYLYHGCSVTNEVNAVPFAISAPGRLPAAWLETWTSQVDIAPTLADVAGIGWTGPREGETLVEGILDGALPERTLFAEGGSETGIVLSGGYKYIRDEVQGNNNCPPYSIDQPYPGQLDALYHLPTDPGEATDLTAAEPEVLAALRSELCGWVLEETWVIPSSDGPNRLVQTCQNAGW